MTDVKTTVFIARHGQTEWNVARRMQGHQDSPLTQLGIKQAEWLGEALAGESIDVIYCSSSPRARSTAEIIRGSRDIAIIEQDAFKEINMGVWEGKSKDEVEETDPEQFFNFWNDPEHFAVAGGESFGEASDRAVGALEAIIQKNRGRGILIVTHSVIVKLLMAYFEKRPIHRLWDPPYIHPACLCKIVLTADGPEILLHGDISHYREETVTW